MANTRFQLKRSTVSGVSPTTGDIASGELGINVVDKKLFSTNGSVVFELGSNLSSIAVGNSTVRFIANTTQVAIANGQALIANGSTGSSGQVLSSNGTGVYWSTIPGGTIGQQQFTGDGATTTFTFTGGYTSNALTVYLNGVLLRNGVEANVSNGSTFTITPAPANGALIDAVGFSGVVSNVVNTSSQYTWSNTQTFSSNVTFNGLITSDYTGSSNSSIVIAGMNTKGGAGYHDFMMVRNGNTSATNPNKWFRLNNTGTIEVINSGYNTAIMTLTDGGNLTTSGSMSPGAYTVGQVIKDTMLSNTDFTVATTTVATSTSDTDFISYSYTPVSSLSYLIIHVHVGDYSAAADVGSGNDSYFSRIKVDGAEITYSKQVTRDTYTFRTGTLFPLIGRYTNSNTAAKSITVGVRRDSADDSITITNSASALWMRITEIAR